MGFSTCKATDVYFNTVAVYGTNAGVHIDCWKMSDL